MKTAVERAALEPVRAHMLAEAHREAGRILADAHAKAEATVERARLDGEQAVRSARSEGEARGTMLAAAERNQGRARAQSVLLRARQAAQDKLRVQIMVAVGGLRDEPGYAQLIARLSEVAADVAGPGATVNVSPAGGVVARSGRVFVDCSLPRLADLAFEALGVRVRELWTP